jgi:hypothetical protein
MGPEGELAVTVIDATPVDYQHSTSPWLHLSRAASVTASTATAVIWGTATAPWLRPVGRRFEELFLLDSGWDGGVSPQIDPVVLERAWVVTRSIAQALPTVGTPEIYPTPNGGIVLEWNSDGSELSIELGNQPHVFYDIAELESAWEGDIIDAPLDPIALLVHHFSSA